jgi:16S rRNA G1207 methylase RsmC
MRGSGENHVEHYFSGTPSSKLRYGLIREHLRGRFFEFLTASGVFSKKRVDLGARLLIEEMCIPEEGRLLDIGCGYGSVGIVAAALNPNLHVFLVDVNERAVRLAKENARRNSVYNVTVKRGFLYEPVEGLRFVSIVSNPPVSAGINLVFSIIRQAPQHLEEDGLFQMVVRSKIASKRLLNVMKETFGNVEILARKSGYRVLLSKHGATKSRKQ